MKTTMKTKIRTTAILAICLTFGIGCASVPMTTIQIPTASGPILVKAPKDSEIDGLEMNLEKKTFSMKSYKARMNPDVIGASAAAQAEIMKQWRAMFQEAAALGAKGAMPVP